MKSFLKTLFAVLVAQILLVAVIVGLLAAKMKDAPDVKSGSVLVQTLHGHIQESAPAGGLPVPGKTGLTHTDILENLEKARHDERIDAVVLRIGMPSLGLAKSEELRERIRQLREAGKPVWAYTEFVNVRTLYLGGACDSLFMMPQGYASLHGFGASIPFVKNALDKLGIKPNLDKIDEYKTAAEVVQRESLSEPSKENLRWMLDTFYPQVVGTIEKDRGLAPGTLESEVFSQGSLVPTEVLEFKLVDALAYWDEVETRLLELPDVERDEDGEEGFSPRPRQVMGCEYAKVERKDAGIKTKAKIAVVHATGVIAGEKSGENVFLGQMMGSATMEEAFREAAEDEDIAAIIYRVDSGGGESMTSWRIQHAALRAQEAKPLVVSMCDQAGSGGYTICYPCEDLIANRLSVVGSIGSISGKINISGLHQKLGISWDFVTRGPNALMDSEQFDFTEDQWESFKSRHRRDYNDWVADIARARGKTFEEIEAVAGGRVWTGEQALAHGLVDELGTFDLAVQRAKEKAEIPVDEEVEFVHFPREKGLLESLLSDGLAAAFHALRSQLAPPLATQGTWSVDWNEYR
jgi:protease-4